MGLLDSLCKRSSTLPGGKDSTDALCDSLYVLLNKDKIQDLSVMRLIVPDGQSLPWAMTCRPFLNRKRRMLHPEAT